MFDREDGTSTVVKWVEGIFPSKCNAQVIIIRRFV